MGRERWHVFLLCAAVLLPGAGGCHNTCVSGVLNSPGSTINVKIGNPAPACTLSQAGGVVHIGIGGAGETAAAERADSGAGAATAGSGMASARIAHIYVTLAGIDAHASAEADDRSPEWQPLAPQFAAQPLQVDLLAPAGGEGAPARMQGAIVPAGVYRQIRLRLAMPSASPDVLLGAREPVVEASRCGTGILHCAVTSDGRRRPLAFASMFDLRIPPEGMGGRWLNVPPDGAVTMLIELERERSFLWPAGEGLRLAPEFRARIEE